MPPRRGLIVVVPAGQDAPVSQFTRRLVEAMSAHEPVRHLDSRNMGDRPGGEVLEHIRSQIADGGHVVCEFDNRASAWSGPFLENADCILFVASADGECSLNEIEQEIGRRETPTHRELVLLHRNGKGSPYSGTLDWLRNRRLDLHHHAALESREDIERVARIVTGRAVALVLSGGGARGFAHIGVIRALREQGIPIDLIGGTSMGACIGAQYVLGWDYQTMLDRNREGWIRLRPLRDYTIPMVSLLTGRKLVRTLHMMFGDSQIEDLALNYFCVSSDLIRGELVVHRRGSLRKYVRASSSVAGIAPPVPDHGSLLVDGGVLNNLPADIMRNLCSGRVIAIDVNPYGYGSFLFSRDYGESLSAWQILRSRLNPFGARLRVPNIQTILERVTMLGGVHHAADLMNGVVDLYIRPPTDEFGFLEMEKLEIIADIGYRFASVEIEAWKNHDLT